LNDDDRLRGESGTLGSAIPSSKGEAIFLKQQQATATEVSSSQFSFCFLFVLFVLSSFRPLKRLIS
jgi:hypothetical protein